MNHSIELRDSCADLKLRGRLTFADSELFKGAVAELESAGIRTCVVDLEGLEFVDSFGLGLLILLYDIAEQRRFQLVLRHPRGMVKERLEYARFNTILRIEE
jgi:anti-anti-sigma factor